MKGLSLDSLLSADFSKFLPFVVDTLKDPSTNQRAFVLILALLGLSTLLLVAVVIGVYLSLGSEDKEYDEDSPTPVPVAEDQFDDTFFEGKPAEVPDLETKEEPRQPSVLQSFSWLLWIAAFALVWLSGGVVSRQDTMCLTCHKKALVHSARYMVKSQDPHRNVNCVSCHETPNIIASVTTAVPARAVHFLAVAGKDASVTAGYGVPVSNQACESCHRSSLGAGVILDANRGVRMSHKEPAAAKALCTDCHSLRPDGGEVSRFIGGMGTCLRCHDGKTAKADCTECHTKDFGYSVASRGKPEARSHDDIVKCGGCHNEKVQCDSCHGMRMPHTTAFKNGGHAREAVLDIWYNGGRKCKACHTETRRPCTKCHKGTFPAHGSPSWANGHAYANPNSNGCDNCHGYSAHMVGRNFCSDCHNPIPKSLVPQKPKAMVQ